MAQNKSEFSSAVRFYKCSVRQYHIGREEIIDCESALAREVPDASAQR